jgi:DNA-3-methyladenine glycosylase
VRRSIGAHTPPLGSAGPQTSRPGPPPRGPVASVDLPSLRAARLSQLWYGHDARIVARALIGCVAVYERREGPPRVARIVETEAYRGPLDLASHARAGVTARTRSLFGQPGHAYVFLVYGMHDCFNVTCGRAGAGHAVLVRAAETIAGIDSSQSLSGPGRFARAMGITRENDGADLTAPPLYVCSRVGRPRIGIGARVGVGYAREWADAPLRFFDLKSSEVSRPPKSAIGRARDRA